MARRGPQGVSDRLQFEPGSILQMPLPSKCSANLWKCSIPTNGLQDFTESAQFTGPENIAPERTLPSLLAPGAVNSPTRITLENNEKIRPRPDRENAFVWASGGQ